jgi:hypothetical protein
MTGSNGQAVGLLVRLHEPNGRTPTGHLVQRLIIPDNARDPSSTSTSSGKDEASASGGFKPLQMKLKPGLNFGATLKSGNTLRSPPVIAESPEAPISNLERKVNGLFENF